MPNMAKGSKPKNMNYLFVFEVVFKNKCSIECKICLRFEINIKYFNYVYKFW